MKVTVAEPGGENAEHLSVAREDGNGHEGIPGMFLLHFAEHFSRPRSKNKRYHEF